MIKRIKSSLNLLGNMGMRYTAFRAKHELLRRSGLLKKRFPVNPSFRQYISLKQWKESNIAFFFTAKEGLKINKEPSTELRQWFEQYKEGKLTFFSSTVFELGKDYDWITNPDTGYQYNCNQHWTEIDDLSKEAGDIKYVWEKSRFSFLYPLIRYDYHFNQDCAELVFSEILSWIEQNPVNCGPNYRCSQEISLRVLNWTFALYYYRHSAFLTEAVFDKIQFAIYWQMKHVFDNIDFSRIAVRNNHAITETLALYLVGLLYPSFPGAARWKKRGKKWFEEEIAYQVYEDGSYLQFSMNYHRVVVQLLTWAIVLAEKNGEHFQQVIHDRAKRSVEFLTACMNNHNGWLPNYGANDGALFFPLNNNHYRDYRPQLQALAGALDINPGFTGIFEDAAWFGLEIPVATSIKEGLFSFERGGYYIIREEDVLTFIRCGGYKDRPSQADNLHIDVWYKNENILCDGGSYKYNTDTKTLRYFMGTASHNTVMLDDYDQMLKGGRFIWYYWTQRKKAVLEEKEDVFIFEGEISAFRFLSKGITHRRKVVIKKGMAEWTITDVVLNKRADLSMKQLWHLPQKHLTIQWESRDSDTTLKPKPFSGYISNLYGYKEKAECFFFETFKNKITTRFKIDTIE